jgi:hypothetical protein
MRIDNPYPSSNDKKYVGKFVFVLSCFLVLLLYFTNNSTEISNGVRGDGSA